MGQKVNPHGFRVGIIKDWSSKWYAQKNEFADLLVEDHKIREYVKKNQFQSGIAEIKIERASNRVKISIFAGKPGIFGGGSYWNRRYIDPEIVSMMAAKPSQSHYMQVRPVESCKV